jgi:hypothetical protein
LEKYLKKFYGGLEGDGEVGGYEVAEGKRDFLLG